MSKVTLLLEITAIALITFNAANAQENKVSITPEPQGVTYRVDGQLYYSASSFVWPTGSKHLLEFVVQGCKTEPIDTPGYQYDETCNVRYTSPSWVDGRGQVASTVPVYVYTADSVISNVRLITGVEFRVKLAFFGSGGFDPKPVPLPNSPC